MRHVHSVIGMAWLQRHSMGPVPVRCSVILLLVHPHGGMQGQVGFAYTERGWQCLRSEGTCRVTTLACVCLGVTMFGSRQVYRGEEVHDW